MKSAKVIEFLQLIPDLDIRELALKYHHKENIRPLDLKVSSLGSAINAAFTWSMTKEGHYFWSSYHDQHIYTRFDELLEPVQILEIEPDGEY